jgi:hypothetical protein
LSFQKARSECVFVNKTEKKRKIKIMETKEGKGYKSILDHGTRLCFIICCTMTVTFVP